MSVFRVVLVLTLTPCLAPAQQAGVAAEWNIRATLEAVTSHVERLQPLLEQLQPKEWISAGAPEAYIQQWNSTRAQVDAVKQTSQELAGSTEKLSVTLELFFRLQSIEASIGSLSEGVRRYQNPALADLITGVLNENSSSRLAIRQYLVDLAKLKEQEYVVMDQEAQRCRGVLNRQPRPVKKK
ncbi:MAG: hypothetical protein ACRD96_19965 [Bryobacteraceae bacterium]